MDRREQEVAGLSAPAWAGQESCRLFPRGSIGSGHSEQFLDNGHIVYRPNARRASSVDYVVGWGTKEATRVAERFFALRFRKPLLAWRMDSFARFVPGARNHHYPWSSTISEFTMAGIDLRASRRF